MSTTNHLILEHSPYLQQHAHNPVDWYPWGEEAFERAKNEAKPIFLSVGYSTCHWCHVMERESFENPGIASYLNEHFISIKVDREERPDVDAIYMAATQAMTGSGGWPMTCFLTSELKPFFCGTYFPPVPSYGRPSFIQLLERINELWQTRRDDIIHSASELTNAISESKIEAPTSTAIENAIESCYDYFHRSFDPVEGGFGPAPKFPRPAQLDLLFRYYDITKKEDALKMANFTLKKMALGGMNDQLAGGFHRYSVDTKWFVPHFEKMLYDQAQLLDVYIDAYQITHDRFYSDVAREIADFVLSDMTHPSGGFYSAYDADSEGKEGKCYVWTRKEIESILSSEDAKLFCERFGITETGNWEEGTNILFRARSTPEIAKAFGIDVEVVRKRLDEAKKKLLAVRKQRVQPGLDDKILTSWNGLMIGAFARASYTLGDERYVKAAERAARFIRNELWEKTENKLFHRWHDGDARFPAYLDSYAFFIGGLLDLYEATFDDEWLSFALTLQKEQDDLFYDVGRGGYFASREQTDLILRTKNDYDGAEPSGNSVSVDNLFRLSEYTGKELCRNRAIETISFFSGRLAQYPYTMPALLGAAVWQEYPSSQIVIAGSDRLGEYKKTRAVIGACYLPRTVVLPARSDNEIHAPFTRSLVTDNFTIYYCDSQVCELPVHSALELEALLGKKLSRVS